MSIKLKPGIVYFLRERDFLSGDLTRFCKIGLVAGDRTTEERIKEHQTGNPREIQEQCSVETAAVDELETYLHARFAPWRIHGEWFLFSPTQLDEAIEETRSRSQDIARVSAALGEVQRLKTEASSGPERPATKQEKATHAELIDIWSELNKIQAEREMLGFQLKAAMSTAPGLEGVINVEVVTPSPVFDEGRFHKENEALFNDFLVNAEPKVSASFRLTAKPSKREWPIELAEQHAKLKNLAPALDHPDFLSAVPATRDKSAERLHEKYLEKLRELSQLKFDANLLEGQLKAACGNHEGIQDVCTWKRELGKSRPLFDKTGFKKAHSKLFERYLIQKPPKVRVKVSPHRAYKL